MKHPEIEKRIKELMSEMTLEEKVGQLHQAGGSLVGAFDLTLEEILTMVADGRMTEEEGHNMLSEARRDWHEDDLRAGRIGSYIGVLSAEEMNRLQHIAVEETRLGIPLINGVSHHHSHSAGGKLCLGYGIVAAHCPYVRGGSYRCGSTYDFFAHGGREQGSPLGPHCRECRRGRNAERPLR